jgi:hypothetical protein
MMAGLSMNSNFEKMSQKKNSKSANKEENEQSQTDRQILISLFEINVIRYALFIENIKPEHIDPFFMIDFMSLPENYFLKDADKKYGKWFLFITFYFYNESS